LSQPLPALAAISASLGIHGSFTIAASPHRADHRTPDQAYNSPRQQDSTRALVLRPESHTTAEPAPDAAAGLHSPILRTSPTPPRWLRRRLGPRSTPARTPPPASGSRSPGRSFPLADLQVLGQTPRIRIDGPMVRGARPNRSSSARPLTCDATGPSRAPRRPAGESDSTQLRGS
jgi:hypothetical protein